MINLLLDRLPESVLIDGTNWAINTDFYYGIEFELLMQSPEYAPAEKVGRALQLFYPQLPGNIEAAAQQMLWFWSCGRIEPETKPEKDGTESVAAAQTVGSGQSKRAAKAYCFEQDAGLILAAFWQAYGIDLNEAEGLHWWKFRALFEGLPAECELVKIMGWRTMDTKGLPKKQKQHYEKLKRLYALKNKAEVGAALSLAERDRRMLDYVERRFAEVAAAKAAGEVTQG